MTSSKSRAQELEYRIQKLASLIHKKGYPRIRVTLATSDSDLKYLNEYITDGCHIIVGTLGKICSLLSKKLLSLNQCVYLAIDGYYLFERVDKLDDILKNLKVFECEMYPSSVKSIFTSCRTYPLYSFAKSSLEYYVEVETKAHKNPDLLQNHRFVLCYRYNKLYTLLSLISPNDSTVIVCYTKQKSIDVEFYLLGNVKNLYKLSTVQADVQHHSFDKSNYTIVGTENQLIDLKIIKATHIINYSMPSSKGSYFYRQSALGTLKTKCTTIMLPYDNTYVVQEIKSELAYNS